MDVRTIGVTAIVAALAAAAPATAAAKCANADVVPSSKATRKQAVKAVLCLINEERTKRELPKLKQSKNLGKAAARWATRMDRENFFAHTYRGSTFSKRIRATGYRRRTKSLRLGENIGWGSGSLATPAARVRTWMAGGLHRRNILSTEHRDIGAAVAGPPKRGSSGATFVITFGGPKRR